jgi:hypothetical protein
MQTTEPITIAIFASARMDRLLLSTEFTPQWTLRVRAADGRKGMKTELLGKLWVL